MSSGWGSLCFKRGELVQLGCRCRAIILFVPSAVGILIPLQTCYLCLFKHIFSLGISHRASFLEKFEFGASYYSVKQQQLKFCETLIVFRELRCEYPKVVTRPPDFWIKLRVSNLFGNLLVACVRIRPALFRYTGTSQSRNGEPLGQ